MPKVNGILETSFYVDDLEVSISFYQKLFGFKMLTSNERFCALHVSGKQVLLLFLKGASAIPSYTPDGMIPAHDGRGDQHVAFSIAKEELEPWKAWLNENNIEIESEYQWPRGGISLYFRDPDNHSLEVVTPGVWAVY